VSNQIADTVSVVDPATNTNGSARQPSVGAAPANRVPLDGPQGLMWRTASRPLTPIATPGTPSARRFRVGASPNRWRRPPTRSGRLRLTPAPRVSHRLRWLVLLVRTAHGRRRLGISETGRDPCRNGASRHPHTRTPLSATIAQRGSPRQCGFDDPISFQPVRRPCNGSRRPALPA